MERLMLEGLEASRAREAQRDRVADIERSIAAIDPDVLRAADWLTVRSRLAAKLRK